MDKQTFFFVCLKEIALILRCSWCMLFFILKFYGHYKTNSNIKQNNVKELYVVAPVLQYEDEEEEKQQQPIYFFVSWM